MAYDVCTNAKLRSIKYALFCGVIKFKLEVKCVSGKICYTSIYINSDRFVAKIVEKCFS